MAKRKKKKGLLGNLNIDINRVGAVAAGAAGAKMLNVPLNRLVDRYAGESTGKVVKMVVPGVKILGGTVLMNQKNQMVSDAGLGMAAIGAIELIDQLIPSAGLGGLGYIDDMERVGNVVEIDLDELAPGAMNGYQDNLDEYHAVAGHEWLDPEMELAGVYY